MHFEIDTIRPADAGIGTKGVSIRAYGESVKEMIKAIEDGLAFARNQLLEKPKPKPRKKKAGTVAATRKPIVTEPETFPKTSPKSKPQL